MGNVESGGDEIPMFLNKYSKIRTEYDQRFGEAHVYRENSNLNNYVLFKEKWFDQSSECERFRKLQNNFNNVDHKNIAKVVDFQDRTDSEWCSKRFTYMMLFEFSETSQVDVMRFKREKSNSKNIQYFTEQEFWYYLKQIMAGLMCLRDRGIFHGDIQPHNILIMEDGNLKLFDPKYFLESKSAYTRKLSDYEYPATLCPKLIEALQMQIPTPPHSPDKAEVYSIGITLLSMMINEDYNIYYDWKNYRVNQNQIFSRIEKLREMKYSQNMINLLHKMLKPDDYDRQDLTDLYQAVNSHLGNSNQVSYNLSNNHNKSMMNPNTSFTQNNHHQTQRSTNNTSFNNSVLMNGHNQSYNYRNRYSGYN